MINNERTEELAQLINSLLCKCVDLNSDPVTGVKLFAVECVCKATAGEMGTSGYLELSGQPVKLIGEL